MKIDTKVMIKNDEGKSMMCPGLRTLLALLEQSHSVKTASEGMGLSLSKAWKLIKDSEKASGEALIERKRGGKNGGESTLTDYAKALIREYDAIKKDIKEHSEKLGEEWGKK